MAWSNTISFLPNLLACLLILLVGYYVAKGISKLAVKGLQRMGMDRAAERGGITRALENNGYRMTDVAGTLIFWGLFLLALQMAFGVFGPNPISALLTRLIAFLPNVIVAALIVVISAAVAAGVKEIVAGSLNRLSYGRFVATACSAAILFVGVFAALSQLGIAPMIINGLFYAMLAIIVGCAIVAIGGGGIEPMRRQWERALDRMQAEAPRLQEQMNANAAYNAQAANAQTYQAQMSARERDLAIQLQASPDTYRNQTPVFTAPPVYTQPAPSNTSPMPTGYSPPAQTAYTPTQPASTPSTAPGYAPPAQLGNEPARLDPRQTDPTGPPVEPGQVPWSEGG